MKCETCGKKVKSTGMVMDRLGRNLHAGDVVVALGYQHRVKNGTLTVETSVVQMTITRIDFDTKLGGGLLGVTHFSGDSDVLEYKSNERLQYILKIADTVGDF